MVRYLIFTILFLLVAVGLGTSWHLYETHLEVNYGDYTTSGICDMGQAVNCEAAAVSDFSSLFGIPIAVWGFGYYLGVALLLLLGRTFNNKAKALLIVFSTFSVFYSIFLFGVSMFLLEAVCPFCFLLYIVNIAFFFFLPYALEFRGPVAMVKWGFNNLFRSIFSLPMAGFVALLIVSLIAFHFHMHQWIRDQEGERFTVDVSEAPLLGNPDAPVSVVVFSDLECPFCAKFDQQLKEVVKEYPDQVKVYFRHFPLDPACNPEHMKDRKLHINACSAAEIAVAAQQQGKFWEAADRMFKVLEVDKADRTLEMYEEAAIESGVDMDAAKRYVDSGKAQEHISRDIDFAFEYGVNKTPTIFINGRKIVGSPKPYALRQFIERELEQAKAEQPVP